MAESNERYNALLEMLEAITKIDLEIYDNIDARSDGKLTLVSRGLPTHEKAKRDEIQNRLKINQKKRTMMHKVDALKDIIQQRDEVKGLEIMASLINEILDPVQKDIFLSQLYGPKHDQTGFVAEKMMNPEYIPCYSDASRCVSEPDNYPMTARCCEPHNSFHQGGTLESISVNGDDEMVKLPLENRYNPSEVYLIHKGIQYSRILLTRSNNINDVTMLQELKSKEVINIVLTESINNDKSYISTLANNYPKSYDEIKFIVQEDKELILRSSIFVNLAQKNIQYLYEFLVKLSTVVSNKNELSRACDQSQVKGITVAMLLSQEHSPEIRSFADKITRFLNRYKQGQNF